MASEQHQMICGLLVRKMANLGYTNLIAFDGEIRDGYFREYPRPVPIGRHRPDCIATNLQGKKAIGEGKTSSDIYSDRTRDEIIDFTTACLIDNDYDLLFLGYPRSCQLEIQKIIFQIPEINRKKIVHLKYSIELDDQNEEY